jgi:hypothetical protein
MFANYIQIRELSLPAEPETEFYDAAEASNWAQGAIRTVRSHGIIQGTGNNLFNPKGESTRAQMAQIFTNLVSVMIG